MSVRSMPGTTHRNGLPLGKRYVYRGAGRDVLTADVVLAEPEPAPAAVYDAERGKLLELMCGPCWEDDCTACQAGTCRCACRDEPPVPAPVPRAQGRPRATDPRCGACGYRPHGVNHRILCGAQPKAATGA